MTERKNAPPDQPMLRIWQSLADLRSDTRAIDLGALRLEAATHAATMEPADELSTSKTSGPNPWVQLGPVAIPGGQSMGQARVRVTGRITAIQIDPTNSKTIYVGTARGGVWKSKDGGLTWRPKSDHEESLAIGALAVAPSNPSIVYAGTGEGNVQYNNIAYPFNSIRDSYHGCGVLVSRDFGETWALQGTNEFTSAAFYRIAVHPSDPETAWAATSRGLFRTTDGGTTWRAVAQGLPTIDSNIIAATDVVINPTTPTVLYAAFFNDYVYRSTNAGDTSPTWDKLGFDDSPGGATRRIALAISSSVPDIVYALVSFSTDTSALYIISKGSGGPFAMINNLNLSQGSDDYHIAVNVDPLIPDLVYVSGTTLIKVAANSLSTMDVGENIHADHHVLVFDPNDHNTIYVGTDGGIYQSTDGGQTWSDWLNAGLCIAQFEFIDQHPSSDGLILGGTQDNGTEQFRNSSVFYHCADGDGGCVAIDPHNPRNMIHEFYNASPERSEFAGAFDSWYGISDHLPLTPALFYPPFALNVANPKQIAFGTDRVYLDEAQGTRGWQDEVKLPGVSGNSSGVPDSLVSAIAYVNDNLILAGTTKGKVFRLTRTNGSWSAVAIDAGCLPQNWIWELATLPNDPNTMVVALSGYDVPHVWLGSVVTDKAGNVSPIWSDISGKGKAGLPNAPVNALAIDPKYPHTIYIGMENGVFRTRDWTQKGAVVWEPFSSGLPNTAVYDLKIHGPTRLLRAATHGRGIWERQLDAESTPTSFIYVRAHRLDRGRGPVECAPWEAAFDDAWNDIWIGDELWPWETPDLKVDSLKGSFPDYQLTQVDDVAFETALLHRNLLRDRVNRLYVQLHNRGTKEVARVTARVYFTAAGPHVPPLPGDFWKAFPALPEDSDAWGSFGDVPEALVLPTEPTLFQWAPIMSDQDPRDCCFLVIADGEKIPPENRIFDVQALVQRERRAALKNVLLLEANGNPYWYALPLVASSTNKEQLEIRAGLCPGWTVGVLFPKTEAASFQTAGFRSARPAEFEWLHFKTKAGNLDGYDPSAMQVVADAQAATIHLPSSEQHVQIILTLVPSMRWGSGRVTLVRKINGRAQGGSTVILRPVL
jgi:photosystem II stability/assembly factor-like uncharacterized protein